MVVGLMSLSGMPWGMISQWVQSLRRIPGWFVIVPPSSVSLVIR
jgi:hypothetical protein